MCCETRQVRIARIVLATSALYLFLHAPASIATKSERDSDEIRGQRLMAVAGLPGALALSEDSRVGYVITPARKVLRLDLERMVTQAVPFDAGTPSALALDPLGRWLAIGTEQQRVVVLDATSGALLHTFNNNLVAVNVVTFSQDGRWLAAGDRDVRVFNPGTGWRTLDLAREPARRRHGATIVWETATWKHMHTFDAPAGATITSLAFDHLANRLTVGEAVVVREGVEPRASLWDLATGQLRAETALPAMSAPAYYFSLIGTDTERGTVLASSVSRPASIEQISLRNCRERSTLPVDARYPIERYLTVHRPRDGSRLVLARHDTGEMAVIHAGTGQLRAILSGLNPRSHARALVSDARSTWLYAITDDDMLWRWILPATSAGDNAWIDSSPSADAMTHCQAEQSGATHVVGLTLGRRLSTGAMTPLGDAPPDGLSAASLDLRGNRLLVTSHGHARQNSELWDVATGKPVCREATERSERHIPACPAPGTDGAQRYHLTKTAARIDHDVAWRYAVVDGIFKRELWSQTLLASVPTPRLIELGPERFVLTESGRAHQWNNGSAQILYENQEQFILALASDRARKQIALYGGRDRNRQVSLLNTVNGRQRLLVNMNEGVRDAEHVQEVSLLFSTDGSRLLVRERGQEGDRYWDRLVVVDVEEARIVHSSQIGNARTLSSAPEVLHSDGALRWRAGLSPRPNRLRVEGLGPDRTTQDFGRHRLMNDVLAISTGGNWVASGGKDGTVKLWDRASGKDVATWQGPNRAVTAMTFDGDARLAVLYHDGRVDILSIAPRQDVPQ